MIGNPRIGAIVPVNDVGTESGGKVGMACTDENIFFCKERILLNQSFPDDIAFSDGNPQMVAGKDQNPFALLFQCDHTGKNRIFHPAGKSIEYGDQCCTQ